MIRCSGFQGKRLAILGLGRTGISAAHALKAGGADISPWDDQEAGRSQATAQGLDLVDLNTADFTTFDALILSPGIPHTHPAPHPLVIRAANAQIPLIGDTECFFQEKLDQPVIGVTGTNGKSTTSALIAHLVRSLGQEVALGGNIGVPVLELPHLTSGLYVLELSSYQLELTPSLDLDVAILLNISPDHLERHGGLDGYIAAKKRIFQNRSKPLRGIVSVDDPISLSIATELRRHEEGIFLPMSVQSSLDEGIFVTEGRLYDTTAPGWSCAVGEIQTLRGGHNAQNIAASYGALRLLGFEPDAIQRGLATFEGLPHRQEWVGNIQGVSYINDSKATNVQATVTALQAYEDASIYLILGGRPKEGGLAPLWGLTHSIAHGFLIGEAVEAFGVTLTLMGLPVTYSGTLDQALEDATQAALKDNRPDPVVLLSPGCASFDQFPHFEARGDRFRAWVKERQQSQ